MDEERKGRLCRFSARFCNPIPLKHPSAGRILQSDSQIVLDVQVFWYTLTLYPRRATKMESMGRSRKIRYASPQFPSVFQPSPHDGRAEQHQEVY
jgi:hypothetical protein